LTRLILLLATIFIAGNIQAQSVFGYWYGFANVKTNSSANNYMMELILQPEKGHVKGVLNYYFKNTYRSIEVKGNYNSNSREVNLYNVPVTYYGSMANMEVDCIMNFRATLRVAKVGSSLIGSFTSLPDYKYMCTEIGFNFSLNTDASERDSVLNAIKNYKETYQVWTPGVADTLVAVNVIQRKVVNYVVENQFKERENLVAGEIELESDSIRVDFYDNGEIDGDSISVFFNNTLLTSAQKLSTRSIHFDLLLDSTKEINELSMFADNLGSIPPNTALMIVDDGVKKHEIRMTSTLNNNGTIRLRRKK
jgi:hypothetical protein